MTQATVKDLVEKLKQMDQDLPVFFAPSVYTSETSKVDVQDLDDFVVEATIAEGYENQFFSLDDEADVDNDFKGVCVG